eukprot:gene2674-1672_t
MAQSHTNLYHLHPYAHGTLATPNVKRHRHLSKPKTHKPATPCQNQNQHNINHKPLSTLDQRAKPGTHHTIPYNAIEQAPKTNPKATSVRGSQPRKMQNYKTHSLPNPKASTLQQSSPFPHTKISRNLGTNKQFNYPHQEPKPAGQQTPSHKNYELLPTNTKKYNVPLKPALPYHQKPKHEIHNLNHIYAQTLVPAEQTLNLKPVQNTIKPTKNSTYKFVKPTMLHIPGNSEAAQHTSHSTEPETQRSKPDLHNTQNPRGTLIIQKCEIRHPAAKQLSLQTQCNTKQLSITR